MIERPVDPVRLHAAARPDRPAIVELETGSTLSYRQLHHRIAAAVAVLADVYGVTQGDRIALLARNCADYVVLHLAAARIGAILVALNWRLSARELGDMIEDSAPTVLLGDDSLALLDGLSLASLRQETMTAFGAAIDAVERPDWRQGDDADLPSLMLFTSGTSGRPKGALLSERNLLATAINFAIIGHVDEASVILSDSPMFHIIGLITNVRPVLLKGGTLLVSRGFDAPVTVRRIGDPALGVTHYFCVPQMAEMLRAADGFHPEKFQRLKALFTGGAPIAPARIQEWLDDGVALANGYGMTEAGTLTGMPLDPERILSRIFSIGPSSPMLEIRLADGEDNPVPPGEVGEIQLCGPSVSKGYWRRPEASAEAFTADGWFRTGDLGRVDEEGYFFLVDRKKDMFISGGENVYPAEIEAVLLLDPAIAEAAVVGVPDEKWGEVGFAALVLRAGQSLSEDGLRQHLGSHLARYKIPKHIRFFDVLPRTGSGKVVKSRLREMLGDGKDAHPS